MGDPTSDGGLGDDGDAGWRRLLAWAADDCGATRLDHVQLGTFEYGGEPVRGLAASRDIAKGEVFMCIPKKCFFNEKRAIAEAMKLPGELCTASDMTVLALAESALKKDPGHAPYVEMLPDEELYRKGHPSMHRTVIEAFLPQDMKLWTVWTAALRHCWLHEYSPAQGEGAVPWKEVYFASVRYYTRRFGDVGLIPVMDLCNTGPEGALTVQAVYNEAEDLCVEAKRDLSKGEELLISYGHSLLSPFGAYMLYGFALPAEHHIGLSNEELQFCKDFLSGAVKVPSPTQMPQLKSFWAYAKAHCTEDAVAAAEAARAQSEEERQEENAQEAKTTGEEQEQSNSGESGGSGSGSGDSAAPACSGAAAGEDGACPASAGRDEVADAAGAAAAAAPAPAGAGPRSAAAGRLGGIGGAPWLLPLGLAVLCCLTSGSVFRARPGGAGSSRRRPRS